MTSIKVSELPSITTPYNGSEFTLGIQSGQSVKVPVPYFPASTGSTLVGTTNGGTGAVTRTVASKLNDTVSVKDFGAVGDGVTDDTAAIQKALNYASLIFAIVFLPAGSYRVSTGITVPAGVTLLGLSGGNGYNGTTFAGGSEILGDLTIGTIVTLNGGAASVSTGIKNLVIRRASGTPAAGTIGLKVISTDQAIIEGITVDSSAIGISCEGQLGMNFVLCNTMSVTDTHVLIKNSYEVAFTDCRFGRNGGGDLAANNYVRIEQTGDTITFLRCQFNQSGTAVTGSAIYCKSYSSANGIINFTSCHAESFTGSWFYQDGSGTGAVQRLEIINSTLFTNPSTVFLQVLTGYLIELNISNSSLTGALNLDQQIHFNIANNFFVGAVLINSGSGAFTGNTLYTGLTVEGTFTDACVVSDNALVSNTTYVNTATGTISTTGNITPSSTVNSTAINKFNTGFIQLSDVAFALKTYTGSLGGAGSIVIPIVQSQLFVLNVQGVYKGPSGEAKPLTFSYADGGSGVVFTGGTASAHYRITVIYSATADLNW